MKKLIKLTGVAIILITIFVAGTVAGANSSWKSEVFSDANSRIGKAGYNKRDEIVDRVNTGIGSAMKDALDPKIVQSETNVEQGLEDYYNEKLSDLENTEAFKDMVAQINDSEQEVIDRYKSDIDKAFDNIN